MKKLFITFCFVLIAFPAWATNYYIDLDDVGSGSAGSFADPWSWSDFTGATLNAANDYYFKCGSDITLTSPYTASVNGTSSVNPITLGAYYAASDTIETGTFGQLCGDGNQKPKFVESGNDNEFFIITGQYVELHSLQFSEGSEAIYTRADDVYLRYLYARGAYSFAHVGTTVDSDNVIIEYNDVDLQTASDGENNGDCIRIGLYATNTTVQYNWLAGWDHAGIQHSYSDSNTIQYNYFYNTPYTSESINFNYNADSNVIRFNFIKDAGLIQMYGGNSNEVYGNVITCNWGVSKVNYGAFNVLSLSTYTNNSNKFYNNTIYDADTYSGVRGIKINGLVSGGGTMNNNEFVNNIIHTTEQYCIHYVDDEDLVSGTIFKNNSCYNYGTNEYAYVRDGSTNTYTTASLFNARADASGNRDDDPGLNNVGSDEFWPASSGSNVVGNGYDLGASYDDLLDPDTTDFTATPPSVTTELQPENWIIGAYNYEGADGTSTSNVRGANIQGGCINCP
jgi:hypothetical protein